MCNLIGSSTSRLSLHILLVVKKTNGKMAERFPKVNEQEIRELLDNTTPKLDSSSWYNCEIYPSPLLINHLHKCHCMTTHLFNFYIVPSICWELKFRLCIYNYALWYIYASGLYANVHLHLHNSLSGMPLDSSRLLNRLDSNFTCKQNLRPTQFKWWATIFKVARILL